MAAPASAAPMALVAMSAPVIGRCCDIEGVWIEPVMAQERMIFDIGSRWIGIAPVWHRGLRIAKGCAGGKRLEDEYFGKVQMPGLGAALGFA